MTEVILTLMDDRRKAKGRNDQLYRTLNNTIHRECRIAKERCMDERCADIETLEKIDLQIMYSKVKDMIGKRR